MAEPGARLISVVGGESTGKSTLAAGLGAALPAIVVPELLRTWVEQHDGRVPDPAEQRDVMHAHRAREVAALRRADATGQPWVVSDSGPLMTAVYSIQYYGDASLLDDAVRWTAQSGFVVWCQDDLAWEPDDQRDGPEARADSQRILARVFADHPTLPVVAAHGPLEERIAATAARTASPEGRPPRPGRW